MPLIMERENALYGIIEKLPAGGGTVHLPQIEIHAWVLNLANRSMHVVYV